MGYNVGEPVSDSNPMPTTRGGDGALLEFNATTHGTPGTWKLLMPADAQRLGARVQAKYASGNCYIKQADAAPSSGAQEGELQIPAAPAYYFWDYSPKRAYYVRGDAASLVLSVSTW